MNLLANIEIFKLLIAICTVIYKLTYRLNLLNGNETKKPQNELFIYLLFACLNLLV